MLRQKNYNIIPPDAKKYVDSLYQKKKKLVDAGKYAITAYFLLMDGETAAGDLEHYIVCTVRGMKLSGKKFTMDISTKKEFEIPHKDFIKYRGEDTRHYIIYGVDNIVAKDMKSWHAPDIFLKEDNEMLREHKNFSDYVNELIDDGFEVEVSKKDGVLTFEVEKDDFEVTVMEPEDGVYQIEDSDKDFKTLKDAVMFAMENDSEDELEENFKVGDKVSFVDPDAKRRISGKLVKKSDLMGIDFAEVEIVSSGGSKNVIKIPLSLLESINENLDESTLKEVVLGTFKKAKSLSVVYDGKNKRVIIKSSAGDKPVVLMRGADQLKGNLPAMVTQLRHTHKDKFEKAGGVEWAVSNESREFVAKAAYASQDGKKKFKLGDKEFPVTIDKSVASKISEAISEAFENSVDKLIAESVEMSMTQKQVLDMGRKMQAMAAKEKDDRISVAMANLADHLEDFGAAFGPKNLKDLAKKTGMSEQIIKMLIQRVQKAG